MLLHCLAYRQEQEPKVNDYARSFYFSQLNQCPVDTKTLEEDGRVDELYSQALRFTTAGWPYNITKNLEAYCKRKVEVTVEDECLLWGRRVVTREACRERVHKELHAGHDGIV